MTEKELMLSGRLYLASDPELVNGRDRARRLTEKINAAAPEQEEYRQELFRELLGSVGENFTINSAFHCDYGSNIHIGKNFYANYDCIIIDVCDVTIGDNVFFAPRVCVFTAGHPIDADIRNTQLEFGKSVTIGNNVWIGGNTVINPGVTIGDNAVIGSGSVVTKDVPAGVVAAGNPCRVLRKISCEDKAYWQAQAQQYRKSRGLD